MEYAQIDYSKWNFDGSGLNIRGSLTPLEVSIWEAALPHQDKRFDKGHAEAVTYFALKLLDYVDADRSIVVPAAMLHDIGWSKLSPEEIDQFYLPNYKDFEPMLRKRHQEEGVTFARGILDALQYPQSHTDHILEIISQHDTRKGFYSVEEGVMRDADKLWRYTVYEIGLVTRKRNKTVDWFIKESSGCISKDGFFYSDSAKKIALVELENALAEQHLLDGDLAARFK